MIKRYIILILSLIIIILVKGYPQNNDIDQSQEFNQDLNGSTVDHQIEYVNTKELRFVVVGDPQINITTGNGVKRLEQVVNYINNLDIDFTVFLGDMTEDGKVESNDIVKSIIRKLKKPYYVVAGNHDIKYPKIFEEYYGPMEHVESINGYQLIFVGIKKEKNNNGSKLNWSFDFDSVGKNAPTLLFMHGPVIDVSGCVYCIFDKNNVYYASSIELELNKFTNLIGVYSGHVHYDSNTFSNNTRYVTVNGLANLKYSKIMNIAIIRASNKIGYSIIKNDTSYYELIPYNS